MKLYPIGEEGAQISFLYIPGESSVNVPESVEPTSIALSAAEAKVNVGKSIQLSARVLPISVAVNKEITWSSANTSIAEVDQNGTVKGIAEGKVKITATTKNGKVSESCEVTVKAAGSETMYGYITSASGVDASYKGSWVSFSPDDPSGLTKIAAGDEIACAANVDGVVYAYLKGGQQLVKIDFKNKNYEYVKVGTAQANAIRSMAYNEKTGKLYGVSTIKMFEIDMKTGTKTALSSSNYFGLGSGNMMNSIAADKDGNIYGLLGLGALCKLDPTDGTGEFIIDKNAKVDGTPTTVTNNSMCFGKDGTLYWASSTSTSVGQNVLKVINAKSGKLAESRGAIGSGKAKITGIFLE